MSKQNTLTASNLSAFALTALFLFWAVSNVEAGTPLKGVDVKLGSNPGGNAAARTTTDNAGHFSFPVQPAGSYTITIERSQDAANDAITVNVKGAAGGAISKTFNGATKPTGKTMAPAPVKVELKSDGQTPLTGTVSRKFQTVSNASKN